MTPDITPSKKLLMKCPECESMVETLTGYGIDDMLNEKLRCMECNYKKYPHIKKQHDEYNKRKQEQEFVNALVSLTVGENGK